MRNWKLTGPAAVDSSQIVLFLVLAASLTLNVVMGLKLKGAPSVGSSGIPENAELGPIPVVDAFGRASILDFAGDRPTLLYILSPTCVWCVRNEENIEALFREKQTQFRFVGLSNTEKGLDEYLRARPQLFPVWAVDPQRIIKKGDLTLLKGLGSTPQTLVVQPGGRVQKVWTGALSATTQSQVEEFFGVKLPGLVNLQ